MTDELAVLGPQIDAKEKVRPEKIFVREKRMSLGNRTIIKSITKRSNSCS